MKYDWETEEEFQKRRKEAKPIKKELIEKLAEKCWIELEYENVVNERTEEVDYELIVECVLRHWQMEALKCFGQ